MHTLIRRWLPLSYAAIALLATLALGAVLLTTLRGYYLQRELDYLNGNVQAIQGLVTRLMALDASPSALESQLKSLAFLSQTRVRLFDRQGQVVADSGEPRQRQEVVMLSMVELPSLRQTVTQTFGAQNYRSVIAVQDALSGARVYETVSITTTNPSDPSISIAGREEPLGEPDLVSYLPAIGTPFGFGFGAEGALDGRRSGQVVRQPLHDVEGDLLGAVELSEGPAYGRSILESVAWGWGVSSGVAVLLAAGAGWLVSRRITRPLSSLTQVTARMAAGDLSVRAQVDHSDELGLLARSFNEMAERIEGTVLALRRFVADAAHELHTPLTALRTNLELAPQGEFIRRALLQVGRLEALTIGLLNLSCIEAGEHDRSHPPVVLNALLQETAEMYASQAEQMGLAFELTTPQSTVVVSGVEVQLRDALANLLDNAIKFTPQGGTVGLSLDREDDRAVIRVQDTGIGIPAQDSAHVFDRFHRGSNTASYPGSGLGLAIVKAIVERHGGTVEVERLALGTRLVVHLPLD